MRWGGRLKSSRSVKRRPGASDLGVTLTVKVVLAVAFTAVVLFDLLQKYSFRTTRQTIRGKARAIDGDTLMVDGLTIRLHGIDAPERHQTCKRASGQAYRCGEDAHRALKRLVAFSAVTCERQGAADKYGRMVARCSAPWMMLGQAQDLSAAMVESGHAIAYREYAGSSLAELVEKEQAAKQAKRGLWQGKFAQPADWRQRHRNL